MALFDLKVIHSVLDQLEEERGIPKARVIDAIESALATAYKKEYGKRGQIVRARFEAESGNVEFEQVKIVVDASTVRTPEEEENMSVEEIEADERTRYNPEQHMYIEDARRIKKDAELGDELSFPLEQQDEYGRISAQTAKQVIIQKIREAEKESVQKEFGNREGEIVSGTVQRTERGNIYIDLGRTTGILPYEEQIPGERFRQGERVRAFLYSVDDAGRGVFLKLSRSRPEFLKALFTLEAPEVASGVVEVKAIAREAGSRSKIAVFSNDEYVDPVGSLVGQRGVRVATVMSELGGEKIDIIEYSEYPAQFVEEALSPAHILSVDIDEEEGKARVLVAPDQQSLAIGKGGQNARLAAKLTGLRIDIASTEDGKEEEVPTDKELAETAPEAESLEDEAPEVVEELSEEVVEENTQEDLEEAENEGGESPVEGLDTEGLDESPVDLETEEEKVEEEGGEEDDKEA